jgi:hypothetical protein
MARPPKRNYNSRAGQPKRRDPFAPQRSGQSGLGSAYNSTTDPRGPNAYVPVPPDPTQGRRTRRSAKPKGYPVTPPGAPLPIKARLASVPIPDRIGDQQRRRWQQEMQIREGGMGRDGGPSVDDTPARFPYDRAKPHYPADMNGRYDDNPRDRKRRGRRYYRTD